MDFLRKSFGSPEVVPPRLDEVVPPPSPAKPQSPSALVTTTAVQSKEAEEMNTILKDGAALKALCTAGLDAGTLEETPSLELLSELSGRLLCRNRSRAAAVKFGMACVSGAATEEKSISTAAASLLPSYFRQETTADEGEGSNLWVSKVFLHGLPGAPAGTSLCCPFSLQENTTPSSEEPLHDLNLKVLQVTVPAGSDAKLSFSFSVNDVSVEQASDWTLDAPQRDKLTILAKMLGLNASRWTPVGVLGLLLSGCGCEKLDEHAYFSEVLRSSRAAQREELLANSGSQF